MEERRVKGSGCVVLQAKRRLVMTESTRIHIGRLLRIFITVRGDIAESRGKPGVRSRNVAAFLNNAG